MSEEIKYEYYLELRRRNTAKYSWKEAVWIEVENPEWDEWHDASGYNKEGSVYSSLRAVKGVITGHKKNAVRNAQYYKYDLEFRLFRRPVITPPPWEPCDV